MDNRLILTGQFKKRVSVTVDVPNTVISSPEKYFDFERIDLEVLEGDKEGVKETNIVYENKLLKKEEKLALQQHSGIISSLNPAVYQLTSFDNHTAVTRFLTDGYSSIIRNVQFRLENLPANNLTLTIWKKDYDSYNLAVEGDLLYTQIIEKSYLEDPENPGKPKNILFSIDLDEYLFIEPKQEVRVGINVGTGNSDFIIAFDNSTTSAYDTLGNLIKDSTGKWCEASSLFAAYDSDKYKNFFITVNTSKIISTYKLDLMVFTNTEKFKYYLRYKTIFTNGSTEYNQDLINLTPYFIELETPTSIVESFTMGNEINNTQPISIVFPEIRKATSYKLYRKINKENYNLIYEIKEEDIDSETNSVAIVDDTYTKIGVFTYKIVADLLGIKGTEETFTKTLTGTPVDPEKVDVHEEFNGFKLAIIAASTGNLNILKGYKISMKKSDNSDDTEFDTIKDAILLEECYEGSVYSYLVDEEDVNKYHKFWVEGVVRNV